MDRRTLLRALAALPLAAAPLAALAQDRTLTEVSKYLNQLRSVKGRFTQINANGSRSRGTYYLRRPGFIRFEYDGDAALVIADGTNIGVFDAKSNTGAQKYPLGTTPLRLLLRDNIDLNEPGVSRGTSNDGTFTSVVLQDPRKPRDGSMTLTFSNRPPALKQWVVTEKSGQKTTVVLETIEKTAGFDRDLFNIELAEIRRR